MAEIGGSSLKGKELYTLEGIGIRKHHSLFLQNNYITTFEHYGVQPNIRSLHLEDNYLSSFYGLEAQPKLENIWLQRNPIANNPNYRIMCLLAVGPCLRKIDDTIVTSLERWQSERLGASASKAVRLGWLLTSPDLSPEEVEQIYQQQLAQHIEKFRNGVSTEPHALPPPRAINPSSPSLLTRPTRLSIHL